MRKHVFIIAEAGVNHNGDLLLAEKLIDAAAEAGADAVKFQMFKAENLVSRHAPKAEYQLQTTGKEESQYDMIKKLELDKAAHERLMAYASAKNIMFLSSPFDLDSIDELVEMGMEVLKVPSGEIINLPYLRKLAATGKPIILSTGMCSLAEIEKALEVLQEAGADMEKVSVLHCNTEYPTPMKDVNLNAMITIRDAFKVKVGYSDHTNGIEVPIAAVALGAEVIEKHFTLDRNMEGPDHAASLTPQELAEMVRSIRNIELALGNGIKTPSESEKKNIGIARKSLVAKKPINKGEKFSEENIIAKRPGTGISPMMWDDVIGREATKDFSPDELIVL